jgi:hypothetical protein
MILTHSLCQMNPILSGIHRENTAGVALNYADDKKGVFKMGPYFEIITDRTYTTFHSKHLILDVDDIRMPELINTSYLPVTLNIDYRGRLGYSYNWWLIGSMIGIIGLLWK